MMAPAIRLSPGDAGRWLRARMPSPRAVARRAVQAVGVVALVVVASWVVVPILGFVGAGIAVLMGDPHPAVGLGIAILRAMVGV